MKHRLSWFWFFFSFLFHIYRIFLKYITLMCFILKTFIYYIRIKHFQLSSVPRLPVFQYNCNLASRHLFTKIKVSTDINKWIEMYVNRFITFSSIGTFGFLFFTRHILIFKSYNFITSQLIRNRGSNSLHGRNAFRNGKYVIKSLFYPRLYRFSLSISHNLQLKSLFFLFNVSSAMTWSCLQTLTISLLLWMHKNSNEFIESWKYSETSFLCYISNPISNIIPWPQKRGKKNDHRALVLSADALLHSSSIIHQLNWISNKIPAFLLLFSWDLCS